MMQLESIQLFFYSNESIEFQLTAEVGISQIEENKYVYQKQDDYWIDLYLKDENTLQITIALCNPQEEVLFALDRLLMHLFLLEGSSLNNPHTGELFKFYNADLIEQLRPAFEERKVAFRRLYKDYTAAVSLEELLARRRNGEVMSQENHYEYQQYYNWYNRVLKSTKLNAENKDMITKDWQAAFPNMGIYKPMWLLQRNGPLLIGISLERNSNNNCYFPTAHLHLLLEESAAISLSFYSNSCEEDTGFGDAILVDQHKLKCLGVTKRLKRQVVLPLSSKELTLQQIQKVIKRYYKAFPKQHAGKYRHEYFTALVLLTAYVSDSKEDVETVIEESYGIMKTWPVAPPEAPKIGTFKNHDAWRDYVTKKAFDKKEMSQTVSAELKKHKLEHIPDYGLVMEVKKTGWRKFFDV